VRATVKLCLHLSLILSAIADRGGFHGINQECIMKIHSKYALWLALAMLALAHVNIAHAQGSMRSRYDRQVGASHLGAPSSLAGQATRQTSEIRQRIQARMAERRDAFINELGLSNEQRQQWDALMQRRNALGETQREQQAMFRARLDTELDGAGDLKALHQEFTRAQDAQIAQRRQLQRDYLAFYDSLNATQQSKLRGHLQALIDRVPAARQSWQD
jgi:LTXXQ motif family protein